MPRPKSLKPSYCLDRSSGRAFVTLNGKRRYLGKHGTYESRDEYDRVYGEWVAAGRQVSAAVGENAAGITVSILIAGFWEHVQRYHGKYDNGYEVVRGRRFERMKQMGLIDAKWELSPPPQPWAQQPNKQWEARCMEVYAAQVERMDQGIGRILDALKQTRQLDNTLILFLQDNGACVETMGRETHEDRLRAAATQPMKPDQIQLDVFPRYTRDGRPVRDGENVMPGPADSFVAYGRNWANVSNTPFREYKHFVHEGGIATPLIACWPAGIPRRGELEPQPGHLIDVMPTIVELAGATFPKTVNDHPTTAMQGLSLVPSFTGKSLERRAAIFFEHEGNRAVRRGDWKLVAKGAKGAWELHDMVADRTEMRDLAAEQPQRVAELSALWQKWAEESHVLPLNPWAKKADH